MMTDPSENLLTQSEASVVASVPIKAVYKAVAERLPKSSLVRRSGQTMLKLRALICVRLDYDLPKSVPVKVRRFVYEKLDADRPVLIEYSDSNSQIFRYVIDPRPTSEAVHESLRQYSAAMDLIVEDPDVQGGVATFKGTRLPVEVIGTLLQQGISWQELSEDYPSLTRERAEAAQFYMRANPRRGRPRKPSWHGTNPLSVHSYPRLKV